MYPSLQEQEKRGLDGMGDVSRQVSRALGDVDDEEEGGAAADTRDAHATPPPLADDPATQALLEQLALAGGERVEGVKDRSRTKPKVRSAK